MPRFDPLDLRRRPEYDLDTYGDPSAIDRVPMDVPGDGGGAAPVAVDPAVTPGPVPVELGLAKLLAQGAVGLPGQPDPQPEPHSYSTAASDIRQALYHAATRTPISPNFFDRKTEADMRMLQANMAAKEAQRKQAEDAAQMQLARDRMAKDLVERAKDRDLAERRLRTDEQLRKDALAARAEQARLEREAREKLEQEKMAARADEARARQLAISQRTLARQTKQVDKAAEKAAVAQDKYYLEGFDHDPKAAISVDEAKKARAMKAHKENFDLGIGKLLNLYEKYGTEALPTQAKATMESLATDLRLIAKNEEQYKLGVLAGPDLDLLKKVLPSPSDPNQNMLGALGSDTVRAQLSTARDRANDRFVTTVKNLGYSPRGTTAPAAKARRAYSPSANKTYTFGPDNAVVSVEEGNTLGR